MKRSIIICMLTALILAGCKKDSPAPSVANGHGLVYIGSNDGSLYAFDLATGNKKWSAKTGAEIISTPIVINSVYNNGVVYNAIVFVGSKDGYLYAFDAFTGTKRWSFQLGSANITDPLVIDDIVYIACVDKTLYAVNALSGTLKWSQATHGIIGPTLAASDDILYYSSTDGQVVALHATDGASLWTVTPGTGASSPPAVFYGALYVGSSNKYFYTLDAATGMTKDVATNIGSPIISPPTLPVYNDMIFAVGVDGVLYEVDQSPGDWYTDLKIAGSGPTVANEVVYVGSSDNRLYAIGATTAADFKWTTLTGGAIQSSPTVAGGVVYVGSMDNKLYAINTADGKVKWTAPTNGPILSSPSVMDSTGIIYQPHTAGDQ